jgi:hypothetical protein
MLRLRFGQVWDGHGAVEHVFLRGVIFHALHMSDVS